MTTHNEERKIARVGVDLDGVVYDFVGALRAHVAEVSGRDPQTLTGPSTWDFYADDWGLSLQQFLAYCHQACADGVLFNTGDPLAGVKDGIDRLLAAGLEVHIVTDRAGFGPQGEAARQTERWLAAHSIAYTTLTLSPDKASVPTDVFIEDRPEYFEALTAAGRLTFLREHPYNAHVQCPAELRVPDFTAFVDRVLAAA